MKIIDLLNKIANGEEVPRKFTYKGYLWEYDKKNKMWFYYFGEGKNHRFDRLFYLNMILNDTVEILEEPIISKLYINNELQYDLEEKKLPEKLEGINSLFKIEQDLDLKGFLAWQKANNKMIENKINSIIDYLESKGE